MLYHYEKRVQVKWIHTQTVLFVGRKQAPKWIHFTLPYLWVWRDLSCHSLPFTFWKDSVDVHFASPVPLEWERLLPFPGTTRIKWKSRVRHYEGSIGGKNFSEFKVRANRALTLFIIFRWKLHYARFHNINLCCFFHDWFAEFALDNGRRNFSHGNKRVINHDCMI